MPSYPQIYFSHDYYKFQYPQFTTIRGKTYPDTHKLKPRTLAQIVVLKKVLVLIRVKKIHYKTIRKIPLEILKKDAEYPGFTIQTQSDFVNLINTFRRFKKATLDSLVSIIYLERESFRLAQSQTQKHEFAPRLIEKSLESYFSPSETSGNENNLALIGISKI